MEYITRHNQSPYELGTEFLKALEKMGEGLDNKDAEHLFDYYVKLENEHKAPIELQDLVYKRNNGQFNMLELPIIKNNNMKISLHLLAWVGSQSSDIPAFCTVYLGLLAAVFYYTYSIHEEMTLKWFGEHGGRGKIIYFRQLLPWASASTMNDNKTCIFDVYPFKDLAGQHKEEIPVEVSDKSLQITLFK